MLFNPEKKKTASSIDDKYTCRQSETHFKVYIVISINE